MTTRINYHDYITSDEWRSRHPGFLKSANYRCAALPWVKVGRGHRYNCHHLTYTNLGNEHYWWDVLCVSPWVHDRIIHGLFSGGKRPHQQQHYPNLPQSVFHNWCRLPAWVKLLAVCCLLAAIGYAVDGLVGGAVGAIVFILVLWR